MYIIKNSYEILIFESNMFHYNDFVLDFFFEGGGQQN